MEEFQSEIHLLSDVLKNNSISETTNYIINKYQLKNNIYKTEEDVFNIVGELSIINEDIWKDNTTYEEKVLLEDEMLFDIYKELYSSVTKKNKNKQY